MTVSILYQNVNDICMDVSESAAKSVHKLRDAKKTIQPTALAKCHEMFNIDTSSPSHTVRDRATEGQGNKKRRFYGGRGEQKAKLMNAAGKE